MEQPLDAATVLAALNEYGSPPPSQVPAALFWFCDRRSLPAPLAANLLAGIWDQNAVLEIASPLASKLEGVSRAWLLELLGLPSEAGSGFVSGATLANFAWLGAARHALLAQQGWDVEMQGLFGAPPITVIAGDEVHASALKAIGMLGAGS